MQWNIESEADFLKRCIDCLSYSGTLVVFEWRGSFHNVEKVGTADDFANCNGITNTAGTAGSSKYFHPLSRPSTPDPPARIRTTCLMSPWCVV